MWAHTDLEHDSWLREEEGQIVAAGGGQLHAGTYFARGCVRPGAKGRGPRLDSARAFGAASKGARCAIRAPGGARSRRAARAACSSRADYRTVRRYYEMTIELDEGNTRRRELPKDVSISTFSPEDAEAWHAAMNRIFEARSGA